MGIWNGRLWWSPILVAAGCGGGPAGPGPESGRPAGGPGLDDAARDRVVAALVAVHGEAQAERIRRGVRQAADRWQADDGDADAFAAFASEHFLADPRELADTFAHLEYALEMLDGHALTADREIGRFQDLDEGPMRPVDALLAAYGPGAHIDDDLFRTGVAFAVLLNLPLTTLDERVGEGRTWSRERWAHARLAQRFEHRLPASVIQDIDAATAAAGRYIDAYNIRMDRLVLDGGPAGYPDGTRLISHWGLRDEIRALYGREDGLPRQRLIAKVMERIVRQEIPAAVVDSGDWEWDPESNRVRRPGESEWRDSPREDDARYRHLRAVQRARAGADPYFPALPTHIDRSFARDREMSEDRVRALLESILTSPTAAKVGARIAESLGRPLEPFDLWYAGFRPSAGADEDALSRITRARYPDADAFRRDIPRILGMLGFDAETAAFLAERIVVEPSRGPGEAVGAARRDDRARLRTRVGPDGMDYKGFNIAVHEMGHTVEQVFSVTRIDHTLLQGVPNTGFTEAFAFLFQARDLELLGETADEADRLAALRALDRFWSAYEISGVALLDVAIWHWMVDHPGAGPAETRDAMVALAREIWNRYYAPVFGVTDVVLPAIYSHIIAYGLYTPDYPLGMIITSQVERFVRERNLATEMERMCLLGRIAPDVWMTEAVGEAVSSEALLAAAEEALARPVR